MRTVILRHNSINGKVRASCLLVNLHMHSACYCLLTVQGEGFLLFL